MFALVEAQEWNGGSGLSAARPADGPGHARVGRYRRRAPLRRGRGVVIGGRVQLAGWGVRRRRRAAVLARVEDGCAGGAADEDPTARPIMTPRRMLIMAPSLSRIGEDSVSPSSELCKSPPALRRWST